MLWKKQLELNGLERDIRVKINRETGDISLNSYLKVVDVLESEEQKNQINKITDKFKELRSLVYGYKDDKEKEISNLSEDQLKLKNELETHKISYETLVDKATLEIENFIKKHDTDTNVH